MELISVDTKVWRETYLSVLISQPDGRRLRWLPKKHVVAFVRDGHRTSLTMTRMSKAKFLDGWV